MKTWQNTPKAYLYFSVAFHIVMGTTFYFITSRPVSMKEVRAHLIKIAPH